MGVPQWIPVSSAQTRLWFIDQLTGSDPGLNLPLCWHIQGPLALGALFAALTDVVARHESLRTVYSLRGAAVMQMVLSPSEAPIRFEVLDSADALADAIPVVDRFIKRSFDIESEPSWRAAIVPLRLSTGAVFIFSCHHISFDGWSEGVLARDLSHAYNARLVGRHPNFGPPLAQVTDLFKAFARPQADNADSLCRFWESKLSGLAALPLPQPRFDTQDRSRFVRQPISTVAADAFVAMAKHTRTSLFTVLLTWYARAMSELLCISDFCVGIPYFARESAEFEDVIGCLLDVLPVRVGGCPGTAFSAAVLDTKDAVLGALEHSQLPFEEIVRVVGGRRSRRHPVFQTMFALQNTPVPNLHLESSSAYFFRPDPPGAIDELTVEAWAGGGRPLNSLSLWWRPSAVDDLFVSQLQSRMVQIASDINALE